MTLDRTLARGLTLAAIALAFGGASLRHSVGSFAHAGPGLFPLLVSALLGLLALLTLAQVRWTAAEPMEFQLRNIGLLMLALCGFALISHWLNMVAGIVFMVLVASRAGRPTSWLRKAQIAAGLVAIAFGFQKLLGLNLPLL